MARIELEMLLEFLDGMDLRVGVPDSIATRLETLISLQLNEVQSWKKLPYNDPLRFDKNGVRLSREALDDKLEDIIQSWTPEKRSYSGGTKNYQGRL